MVPNLDALDRWSPRLSEYVDGELPPRTCRALEAHLRGCPACRAELEELRRLAAAAPGLRVDEEPSSDLWPGIVRRLEPRSKVKRLGPDWPAWLGWPPALVPRLAVAALLLVAVGWAGVNWLNRQSPAPAPPEIASVAPLPAVPQADPEYRQRVAALEREARDHLQLDPRLVTVLEENLATLDVAIANYREALAAEPADERMRHRLVEARQRKLDVLRQAVTLAEGTN